MRWPSIRNPRSIWDIFAVLIAYLLVEYIVLRITGSFIVQQELVIIAILVAIWALWAILRILSNSPKSNMRIR